MNDCPIGELRDRLPDLLHDRLAPEARRELEAHLATCAECRAELALLRAAHASLQRAPAVDVARIVAALPAPRRTARRSWSGWRTAAAIAFLAVSGTSIGIATSRHDAARAGARELAVGGGAIAALSDRELSALLKEIESIEVVPPSDVETAPVVSAVAPATDGIQ